MKDILTEWTKLQLILFDLDKHEYPKMSLDGKRNFILLCKMFNIKKNK